MKKSLSVLLGMILLSLSLSSCGKKAAEVQAPPTGFLQKGDSGTISLDVKPWPARTGKADLTVQVIDAEGKPVDNAKVGVSFSMPGMSMGGPKVDLTSVGKDGTYAGNVDFSMATGWKAQVSVDAPGKEAQTADFTFKIEY